MARVLVELRDKMNFWNLMIRKDDYIVSLAMFIRGLKYKLKPSYVKMKHMATYPPEGEGKDLYIILNAPSLMSQDLSVLKGKTLMFVNRGFTHPLYMELSPKYHVFVDPKLVKGIWPVEWLAEIHEKSPKTTILLPIEWANLDLFKPYHGFIKWLTWQLPFYNLAVAGCCISYGIQQKYDRIYFTGFDANGIGYELVRSANSHFYGNDKELEGKSTEQFSIDLYMHSRHFHDLNRLALFCKKKGIKVINITNGGLLDMFPREKILPVINN